MRARRCADAAEFLDRAGEWLCRDEARNSLPLGLTTMALNDPEHYAGQYEAPPFFAVVEDSERMLSAAVRTPPHGVAIAGTDDPAAVAVLAQLVHTEYGSLPGAHGTGGDAAVFATAWAQLSGQTATVKMREQLYRCSRVVGTHAAPGSLRAARESDRELLVDWFAGFLREAFGEEAPEEQARRIVDVRLHHASAASGLRIWEDDRGEPATLVGFGRATPHGITIAPVWTPRERRGQGFGTAATAATTRELLESGRDFVCLFADLANRTSSRIYQAIGYRRVCDAEQWVFAEAGISPS